VSTIDIQQVGREELWSTLEPLAKGWAVMGCSVGTEIETDGNKSPDHGGLGFVIDGVAVIENKPGTL